MNPAKIKTLAKQGNPQAIAILLNRSLQRQGITAKVGRENDCLQVMLESAKVPPPQLAQRLSQWLINLGIESIERVQIYGKQISEEIPDWNQDIELANPTQSTPLEVDSSLGLANSEPQDLSSSITSQAKITTPKTSTPETPSVPKNDQHKSENNFTSASQSSLKIASQTKRFFNYVLDVLLFLFLYFVVGIVVIIVLSLFDPDLLTTTETNETTAFEDFIYNLIGYVGFLLYYIISESLWSKSPAKFITKTKVVNNQNQKPTVGQIFLRTAARYLPFEPFSFLGSNHPRGWHDKVSGTKVVDD